MTGEPFIIARSLTRTYRKGRADVPVFSDLNFSVDKNEFVAILGPSGSGKSTILNLLAGFDAPSAGQLIVDGVDLTKLNAAQLAEWRLRTVGFVFQSLNVINVFTAFENVEFPLRQLGMKSEQRRTRVERALSLVGLLERQEHYPHQLSGGEEQRVAIARAIIVDANLIVADEPTGNLDANAATRVLEILRILHDEHGKTIVLVTHDLTAAAYAKRRLVLNKGVIVDEGATMGTRPQ